MVPAAIAPEINREYIITLLESNGYGNYHMDSDKVDEIVKALNEQLELEIGERLDSAFNFARSFPGFYLMICEGKSCFWLTISMLPCLVGLFYVEPILLFLKFPENVSAVAGTYAKYNVV